MILNPRIISLEKKNEVSFEYTLNFFKGEMEKTPIFSIYEVFLI